jgi:predicted dehydrogenase
MLKIGIIGSGFGLYGLLPAFSALPDCQVVAMCGKRSERLLVGCQTYHVKNIYDNWRLMLEAEEMDAIALAVTPNAQYQIAKASLNRGLHIFAEKPLAATSLQAEELLALAKEKAVTHCIDFIFPELDAWKQAKQVIDSKVFGELSHIGVNWDFLGYDIRNKRTSWKTESAEGGGALAFYFSHALYYLENFAGEIQQMRSHISYSEESLGGGDIGVDILLKFKGEVSGYAHIRSNTRGFHRHQVVLQCQRGTMILESQKTSTISFVLKMYDAAGNETLPPINNPNGNPDEDERVEVVKTLAARFLSACASGAQMSPSFEDGARVQRHIEQIRAEPF